MKFASDFQVLGAMKPNTENPCTQQPRKQPVLVAQLLDKERFIECGYALQDQVTVAIGRNGIDWEWRAGRLYYFGKPRELGDQSELLCVFEEEEVTVIKPQHPAASLQVL